MAVMRHSIIFGGIDSADFNIYIGGEGTFNAPERDVEMISIPGRDGAFALDKGRFENIEVKYTVINQEPDLATFSANLEAFRNALCSFRGYQRLEDTFHPDEFRMAVFADKFEVKPIEYNTASKFDIVFDCKPQRYLTDGETAVSVEDGDTLTNPTLFEAHPLLEVEGYGTIGLNGYSIALDLAYIGDVTLVGATSGKSINETYSSAMLLDNDTITLSGASATWRAVPMSGQAEEMVSATLTLTSQQTTGTPTVSASVVGRTALDVTVKWPAQTFAKGGNATLTDEGTITVTYKDYNSATQTASLPIRVYIMNNSTDAAESKLRIINSSRTQPSGWNLLLQSVSIASLTGYSTQSMLGDPTYIDCDLGEAYKYVDGAFVSLNRYIDLGSKLPELSPGENEVTCDNTITDLQIVPRWWRI